jgi:hypothetical protein
VKKAEGNLNPSNRNTCGHQSIGQPSEQFFDGPIFETRFHHPSGSIE